MAKKEIQNLVIVGVSFIFFASIAEWGISVLLIFVLGVIIIAIFFPEVTNWLLDKDAEPINENNYSNAQIYATSNNTYLGEELNFTEAEIIAVLTKRFPYFLQLSLLEKKRFVERLQIFIADKIFKIHGQEGFKEMPIMVSAAAVQLTFGLKKYLLPYFKYFNIYPEEFLGTYPTIRFLEGNVSGNSINLSWKHFLKGYEIPIDGQNVGLHELSHALYYQTFVIGRQADKKFRRAFDDFNNYGNKAHAVEKLPGYDLYTEYGVSDFQEFWAESIEIFFEKPWQLKNAHPILYQSLVFILNQDPTITTPLVQA